MGKRNIETRMYVNKLICISLATQQSLARRRESDFPLLPTSLENSKPCGVGDSIAPKKEWTSLMFQLSWKWYKDDRTPWPKPRERQSLYDWEMEEASDGLLFPGSPWCAQQVAHGGLVEVQGQVNHHIQEFPMLNGPWGLGPQWDQNPKSFQVYVCFLVLQQNTISRVVYKEISNKTVVSHSSGDLKGQDQAADIWRESSCYTIYGRQHDTASKHGRAFCSNKTTFSIMDS